MIKLTFVWHWYSWHWLVISKPLQCMPIKSWAKVNSDEIVLIKPNNNTINDKELFVSKIIRQYIFANNPQTCFHMWSLRGPSGIGCSDYQMQENENFLRQGESQNFHDRQTKFMCLFSVIFQTIYVSSFLSIALLQVSSFGAVMKK